MKCFKGLQFHQLELSPQSWMLRRAEEEDKQKGEEGEKLAAVRTPAVPTGSDSGSRRPVRLIPPPPHTHSPTPARKRGKFELYLGSSAAGRGEETPRYIHNFSPLRAHAGRQDSLKPRTSSSAPEALRSCARSPLPLPSFTSLSSVLFLSDIHLPGSFQIKPSHSNASLTMKKRWVFLFLGRRRTHPSG